MLFWTSRERRRISRVTSARRLPVAVLALDSGRFLSEGTIPAQTRKRALRVRLLPLVAGQYSPSRRYIIIEILNMSTAVSPSKLPKSLVGFPRSYPLFHASLKRRIVKLTIWFGRVSEGSRYYICERGSWILVLTMRLYVLLYLASILLVGL